MLLRDSYTEKIEKEINVFCQTKKNSKLIDLAIEASNKNLSYGQLMTLKYKETGKYA